jgi:triacylglycerol lipase
VTTVAGVNQGSPVADLIVQASTAVGPQLTGALGNLVNAFTGLIDPASEGQNSLGALQDLSTAGTAAFNKKFPAGLPTTACGNGPATVNGINFYSWSGDSSSTGGVTTGIDPSDAIMALGGLTFNGIPNDGLVGSCGSHLGVVIRDNYYQNHLDEVNQVAGLISLFTTSPVTLFENQANRLKTAGL